MGKVIYRDNPENLPLISARAFSSQYGLSDETALAGWLRRYADFAPEVVEKRDKVRYYFLHELNEFIVRAQSTPSRKGHEVAKANVAYLERALRDLDEDLRDRQEAETRSQKNVQRATSGLRKRKAERVEVERRIADLRGRLEHERSMSRIEL
ncbi:hypothetical protein [Rhodococcus qingshengii]|uniref:hypothetical protein n=1 Tax=Rhodococcus qingshengii TaxID=334542 RepID=UPI0035E1A181